MSGENLSGRQLAVATTVAGLSPAAVCAGSAPWFWVLLWSGVAVLLAAAILWRIKSTGGGRLALPVRALYAGWAVVLSARVLSQVVDRLEQTSGGSPGFWLLVIVVVPLLIIGWGKAAPFFRMTEILWLAMAVTLILVFIPAIGSIEWRGLLVRSADWKTAALAVGEIMIPALFTIPYIYKVGSGSRGRCLEWLSVLGGISAALCLVTTGVLGAGGAHVAQAFFVAAGFTGGNARSEGLLSVIWLLPDLVLVGLLCRSWGERWWPALAVLLSAGVSLTGVPNLFSQDVCVIGSLVLLVIVLLFPAGRGNFVVKKSV